MANIASRANDATPRSTLDKWCPPFAKQVLAALVSRATDEERYPRWSLALQATIGLALFLLIEPFFTDCDHLPYQLYHRQFIGFAALKMLKVWVPLLFCLGLLIGGRRSLGWDQFELHRQTRWFVGALAGVLAFAYSLYSYNFYFDHTHVADRALLVIYALLVWRHPAFAGLAVLQAFIVVGQFDTMVRCTWTDKLMVFELLVLFMAFLVTKILFRRQGFAPFLSAALVVIGIFYLRSGIGKLEIDWLSINHLERLFLSAAHQNSWLAWLGPERLSAIHDALSGCGKLLMLGTLVIELGVIAFLAHRRGAMLLLAACCCMHLGIFVSSGILFWKWMVADAALIAALWHLPTEAARRIFSRPMLAFGAVAMIVLHGVYEAPPKLSWYDSSMCFRFTIEAVGESGQVYQVPPYQLAPYDVAFAQGRFYYIARQRQLAGCMGAVSSSFMLNQIDDVDDAEEFESLRESQGTTSYNRRAAKRFDKLLLKYFAWDVRRRRGERRVFPVKSPSHIWTAAHPDIGLEVFQGQEPIAEVRIRLDEALQRDGELLTMTDAVIRTIDVPGAPKPSELSTPHLAGARERTIR